MDLHLCAKVTTGTTETSAVIGDQFGRDDGVKVETSVACEVVHFCHHTL